MLNPKELNVKMNVQGCLASQYVMGANPTEGSLDALIVCCVLPSPPRKWLGCKNWQILLQNG